METGLLNLKAQSTDSLENTILIVIGLVDKFIFLKNFEHRVRPKSIPQFKQQRNRDCRNMKFLTRLTIDETQIVGCWPSLPIQLATGVRRKARVVHHFNLDESRL